MPAHERLANQKLEAYLSRCILAIARSANGEVRIPIKEMDIDTRQMLVRDFDAATNELVFRACSKYAEAYMVEPEQSAWQTPYEERSRVTGIDQAARHRIPTDAELADEEQLIRARETATRTTAANRRPMRTQSPVTTPPAVG